MRLGLWLLAIGVLPLVGAPKDIKAFYMHACTGCHGQDGSAKNAAGNRLPGRNFVDTRWQVRQKDPDLVKVLLRGKGAMPGFSAQLTEAEANEMVKIVIRSMVAKAR